MAHKQRVQRFLFDFFNKAEPYLNSSRCHLKPTKITVRTTVLITGGRMLKEPLSTIIVYTSERDNCTSWLTPRVFIASSRPIRGVRNNYVTESASNRRMRLTKERSSAKMAAGSDSRV